MLHPILTIFNGFLLFPNAFISLQARPCILGHPCFRRPSFSYLPVSLLPIPYTFSFLNRDALSFCHVWSLVYAFLWTAFFPWPLFGFRFWPPLEVFPNLSCVECDAFTSSILVFSKPSCDHTSHRLLQPHLQIHGTLEERKPSLPYLQILFSAQITEPREWSSFSTNRLKILSKYA